jgi:hypothetical protein
MPGGGMSLPKFAIEDGLITVEEIVRRSWLIRKRINALSPTAPYGWVATMMQGESPTECEVKGYLARQGFEIIGEDYRALKRIGEQLGFEVGRYERVDDDGDFRILHEIRKT